MACLNLSFVFIIFCWIGFGEGIKYSSPQTTPTPSNSNNEFTCPEDFGYFPHPGDCTQYYVCVFGGALLESCTGGLMYSHELQTCDWPRNVNQFYCNATAAALQQQQQQQSAIETTNTKRTRGKTTTTTPANYVYKPIKIENYGDLQGVIATRGNGNEDGGDYNGRSGRSYLQSGPEGQVRNLGVKESGQLSGRLDDDDRLLLFNKRKKRKKRQILFSLLDKFGFVNKPPPPPQSSRPSSFPPHPNPSRPPPPMSHHGQAHPSKMPPPQSHPGQSNPSRPPPISHPGQSPHPSKLPQLPPQPQPHPQPNNNNNNNSSKFSRKTHFISPNYYNFYDDGSKRSGPQHQNTMMMYPPHYYNNNELKNSRPIYSSLKHPHFLTTPRPNNNNNNNPVKIHFKSIPMERQNLHYNNNNHLSLKISMTTTTTRKPLINNNNIYITTAQNNYNNKPIILKTPGNDFKPFPTQHFRNSSQNNFLVNSNNNNRVSSTTTTKRPTTTTYDYNNEYYDDDYNDDYSTTTTTTTTRRPFPWTTKKTFHNHFNSNHLRSVGQSSSPIKYQQTYGSPAHNTDYNSPQQQDYSYLSNQQRYAAHVPANNTASYSIQDGAGDEAEDDEESYYVYEDEQQQQKDNDYSKYAPQQPQQQPPKQYYQQQQQYITTTHRPTTTTTTTIKPRVNPSSSRSRSRSSSQNSNSNSRPTLKPKSSIVPKESAPVRDVYLDAPTRALPFYATPTPNTPATKCRRDTCVLPDCNCGGKDIPAGLSPEQTPQIVLLTFDDSVNDLNKNLYRDLFEKGRKNPNGCPISATFYVSHEWTDYSQVQNLAADGHEIASHSVSHSFGESFSQKKWEKEINGQREILAAYGGVKLSEVRGMRAPFLAIGGNNMFKMLHDLNFTYDSSMPVYENRPPSWPYTLDYKIFHDCMIPPCPTKSYPGVWEVPMVMWQDLKGGRCSMGDACSNPPTAEGVYQMLAKNFERHYTTNRAPFGLYYHAAWFTQAHHKEGFEAFLDTLVQMDDVWLVTNWQALQWMRNPTSNARINEFAPWAECVRGENRPPRCNHARVCNLWHKSGVRYLKTCQACPQRYPWTGDTGVPFTV